MASAPPMETPELWGQPKPPSYDETMNSVGPPHYQQGPIFNPPGNVKPGTSPYPTQQYTQINPTQTYTPTIPIASVQTIYVQPGVVYGDLPVQTICPGCSQTVVSRLEHTSGTMAWLICAGIAIFGCFYGCCLIPFCVDGLKDVRHLCPNCNCVLGAYKRL